MIVGGRIELPVRVAAAGKSELGLCGVVGGMAVIVMLAYTMRLLRGGIAAVGCSSTGAGSIGGKNYCGNLLWQFTVAIKCDPVAHGRGACAAAGNENYCGNQGLTFESVGFFLSDGSIKKAP